MEKEYCQIYRQKILSRFSLNAKIVRSYGNHHLDDQGRRILDGISQYGAVPFGHNPEELVNCLYDYLKSEKPNFIQPFVPETTKKLASKLIDLAGPQYLSVVFTNSGTETVEAAFKLSKLKTGRKNILSAQNSYHGKTFAALSATGSDKYSAEHIVDKDSYKRVEFNNVGALEEQLRTHQYAALILELVQGEGGMIPASIEFIQKARELCSNYGTILIIDEIQTGLGRTGHILASHRYKVSPDIILLSKALGGGIIPIGAMIVSKETYCLEFDKKHSSTFANGGLASAVGLATLEKLQENNNFLISHVVDCENKIVNKFIALKDQYPDSFDFTGMGLMYALHFKDVISKGNYLVNYAHNSDLLSLLICSYLFHEKGIYCMPILGKSEFGSIRFQPPLNTPGNDINYFLSAFEEICSIIAEQRYDVLMANLIDLSKNEIFERRKKNKLIKTRVLAASPIESPVSSFAFLFHSTSVEDIKQGLPEKIKEIYDDSEQKKLSEWIFSFGDIEYTPQIVFNFSMAGESNSKVNGVMIYSPISPTGMMKLAKEEKKKLINEYMDLAEESNAKIVGLGAYTSVISNGGQLIESTLPITTGNSLTAMSTCMAIKELFEGVGYRKKLLIFGARGSVGRIALCDLSNFFGEITIISSPYTSYTEAYNGLRNVIVELIRANVPVNNRSAYGKFLSVANEFYLKDQLITASIIEAEELIKKILSICNERSVKSFLIIKEITDDQKDIDCVFSATSEGKPFLNASKFPDSCLIFDVARPFDFFHNKHMNNIIEGGLVRLPDSKINLSDSNIIGCAPGINLACLSETIALSMENVDKSFSIGREIHLEQAQQVLSIAQKHGFKHFIPKSKLSITA